MLSNLFGQSRRQIRAQSGGGHPWTLATTATHWECNARPAYYFHIILHLAVVTAGACVRPPVRPLDGHPMPQIISIMNDTRIAVDWSSTARASRRKSRLAAFLESQWVYHSFRPHPTHPPSRCGPRQASVRAHDANNGALIEITRQYANWFYSLLIHMDDVRREHVISACRRHRRVHTHVQYVRASVK